MSYFGFLGAFLAVPIVVLWWTLRRFKTFARSTLPAWAVGLLASVAVAYTTPWDNYLVATGVWWYDPDLVTGILIGWVPVEEYLFFVLQPVLAGLWMAFLIRRAPVENRAGGFRRLGLGLAGLLWLASAGVLAAGWAPGTYLALALVWALPPAALQLAFGGDILGRHIRLVLVGIGVPTLYLSAADALAIGSGTWTIDPAQSSGVLLGGVLPLEEFIFFLLTNTLLVFAYVLIWAPESRERLASLRKRLRWGPGEAPA